LRGAQHHGKARMRTRLARKKKAHHQFALMMG